MKKNLFILLICFNALAYGTESSPFSEEFGEESALSLSFHNWTSYKSKFGVEVARLKFPQKPAISQNDTLIIAYAYDQATLYSFAGYSPARCDIDPNVWFDELTSNVSRYPFKLLNRTVYQIANGNWIMDYVAHDFVHNLILKARAIITPFNGYILQCNRPSSEKDYLEYYLDSFHISYECAK